MPTINEDFEGFDLSYENPPEMTGKFQVRVASNHRHLAAKLGVGGKIIDGKDMEDAKANARQFVKTLLGK